MTVVTVTYGDRWPLLQGLLRWIESTPEIGTCIVVDNGAHRAIAPLASAAGFTKTKVLRHPCNLGSAHGFKSGLACLAARESAWIWLLDDDNAPMAEALATLLGAALELSDAERASCAFLAFRPEHQSDIADGVPLHRCYPTRSSFFGFHVGDIPYKIWRRLPWGRPSQPSVLPPRVALPYAPYSGLFLHADLLAKIGLPNADLVLYADDTEFSFRITESGGRIWLLTDAQLAELEPSWNAKRKVNTSFELWLKGGSDARVFYSSRNQAYFDSRHWMRNRFVYRLNRRVYLTMLRLFAWRYACDARYEVVRRAVSLGEGGCLGFAEQWPLP